MTRYMADACNPVNLPAGWLGAVYVDGRCRTTQVAGRRTISSLALADADEGDVEPGNPGWSVWVPWVQRQRQRGNPYPWLYCCADGYGGAAFDGWRHQDGVAAFRQAGVAEPLWRVFDLGTSEIPGYAVALQVAVGVPPGYDVNLLQDAAIPGLDPGAGSVPIVEEMAMPILATGNQGASDAHGAGAVYLVSNWPYGPKRWIEHPADLEIYTGALGMAIQTVEQYALDRCVEEPAITAGSENSAP